jgi:hypothetical protein|tara:strand:- start:2997 stop:3257 length:261 start_codon:yes stop_codon:yes gene_type:complete
VDQFPKQGKSLVLIKQKRIMKKDQIKSRSEYKIMGFTLESMLSHAYALGRINQLYHPEDVSDSLKKEAIYQASKKCNWDVFEIIEK